MVKIRVRPGSWYGHGTSFFGVSTEPTSDDKGLIRAKIGQRLDLALESDWPRVTSPIGQEFEITVEEGRCGSWGGRHWDVKFNVVSWNVQHSHYLIAILHCVWVTPTSDSESEAY